MVGVYILRAVLGALALIVVLGAGALSYRAWRQHENEKFLTINSPSGLVEAGYQRLGGVDQWVQIRGEDRANPVILFLHGGPGGGMIPATYAMFRPWERDFTIVQWDQRGAGRTFTRNRGAPFPGIDRYVEDGIALAEQLRAKFHQPKIILLGLSWGSVVGTEMARRRPDLFYAYVGTGQAVDGQRNEAIGYTQVMARARRAGDKKAIAELERIGPPPYASFSELRIERGVLSHYPPAGEKRDTLRSLSTIAFAPGYSLGDLYATMFEAPMTTARAAFEQGELMKFHLTPGDYAVPMFFFQGADDAQTPTELVAPFVDSIRAPQKELILVPGAGHFAMFVANARLLDFMRTRVRPLALRAGAPAPVFAGGAL